MRRLLEKTITLLCPPARLGAITGGALLSLALAIGASGAAFEFYRMAPVTAYSTSPLSCPSNPVGLFPDRDSVLAGAELNLSFDSGASTSSDRQPIEDLVRLLSHRPVITCSAGGAFYSLFGR